MSSSQCVIKSVQDTRENETVWQVKFGGGGELRWIKREEAERLIARQKRAGLGDASYAVAWVGPRCCKGNPADARNVYRPVHFVGFKEAVNTPELEIAPCFLNMRRKEQ